MKERHNLDLSKLEYENRALKLQMRARDKYIYHVLDLWKDICSILPDVSNIFDFPLHFHYLYFLNPFSNFKIPKSFLFLQNFLSILIIL